MTEIEPLLVVAHVAEPSLEVIAPVAAEHGLPVSVRRPALGEQLPPLDQVRGVIVLGGPQSAYREQSHPYLAEEKRYVASAHAADVPTLAVCLGSHIAADALGGNAHAGETGLEVGFIDVTAVDAAGEELQGRFFSFHSDTMQVPGQATLLAVSDRYVQAWSAGSVLAIQYHPDLDRQGIETLLGFEGEKLAAFGVDVEALRRELSATEPAPGRRLIDAWIASLGVHRCAAPT